MCFGIMNSSKKLLNLLGILAIGSFSFQEAVAVDDLDDTLKQAIILVKLLKSDFAQVLRANEVEGNVTEEEDKNSTCSLPPEDFNSTVAMNGTEVTASGVSSTVVVSTTPLTPASPPPSSPPPSPPSPAQPPLQPNMQPAVPVMMPYVSWPPMPMAYPPAAPAPGQRSFSDLNYRFPYRLSRRRMMPDYYYYDAPIRSRGNFRRFNNELTGEHLGDTTATSQIQTTSSHTSSEATTLHVVETVTSTSSLPTTIQPSTSIPPATDQRIMQMNNFVNQSLLATSTVESTNQSHLSTAKSNKKKILPKTKKPNLPSTLKSKSRLKEVKKRVPKPKPTARTKVISKQNKKKQIKVSHLRQTDSAETDTPNTSDTADTADPSYAPDTPDPSTAPDTSDTPDPSTTPDTSDTPDPSTTPDTPDPSTTPDTSDTPDAAAKTTKVVMTVEMDEIAKVIQKEIEGDENEDIDLNITETTTKKKKKSTTMKIFLQHSSRIPIPFPENNAFCHFHPESSLCGTN